MRRSVIGSGVLLLVTLLGACTRPPAPRSPAVPEIAVGLVTPLSGEIADLGREILNSAQLAVKRVNAEGLVRVRLEVRDDQSNAATASTAVRSLVDVGKVSAVVAAGVTPVVVAEIEALSDADIPVVTPTATATALAEGRPFVFRVIPSNAAQGVALANFAVRTNGRTAAVLVQQEAYSTDLAEAFEAAFTRAGGKIVLKVPFDSSETDFRAQLSQIDRINPDVVLFAAQHVPVARMLVRAREIGLRATIVAGETAYTDKLLTSAGQSAEKLHVTGAPFDTAQPGGELKQFVDAYRAQHPPSAPGLYGAYTYDTVRLIAAAFAESVRTGDRNLIARVRDTRGFAGVSGPITFDATGNVERDYQIYRVEGGRFVGVAPDAR